MSSNTGKSVYTLRVSKIIINYERSSRKSHECVLHAIDGQGVWQEQLPKKGSHQKRKGSFLRIYMRNTYSLKWISRYLPNRLELLFLTVFALPNDSSKGLASSICSVTILLADLLTAARYCIISFVVSVFPDPLSPLITKIIGTRIVDPHDEQMNDIEHPLVKIMFCIRKKKKRITCKQMMGSERSLFDRLVFDRYFPTHNNALIYVCLLCNCSLFTVPMNVFLRESKVCVLCTLLTKW